MRIVIAVATAVLLASTSLALACGTERWAVKTGTDADARAVVTVAQAAQISDLVAFPRPANPNSRPNSRFAPTELNVFAVSAILTVIKREKDEDYHLVLSDPNNPDVTMIVESPDPHCAIGSAFASDIASVRQAIDDQFGPIRGKQHPGLPVVVTGVAFFDLLHGQEGVAPNAIELHPLLSIQFE
jgi:hypothetical protein